MKGISISDIKKRLKILLVNISLRPNSEKILFPIGPAYIATAIDHAGYDLEILDLDALRLNDRETEKYLRKVDFDVAAMGAIVTGYKYIKKLCKMIKKIKNVPIIIGNSTATSIPHILMENTLADIGVMDEGDITIVDLLRVIEQGRPINEVKGIYYMKDNQVVFTSPRGLIGDLDRLPQINYNLFDMQVYLDRCRYNISEPYPMEFEKIKAFPINTARGCPFDCTFCYHVFKGKKFRYRSVKNIGNEILFLKNNYNINYIQFYDELSLFSKKRANEIAEYFLDNKTGVYWSANCRAGLFNDDEMDLKLAKKLHKAGCFCLGYSLESGDEKILLAMNKQMKVEDFKIQTQVLQKAGIIPTTSLVIGYPEETAETLQKTFDICYDSDIYPSAGYVLPQPGTPIYEDAVKTGKIKDEEEYILTMGDRQDFTINLTKMSQKKIEEIVMKNLSRISKKLKLNLNKENLIKTGHYRQAKK